MGDDQDDVVLVPITTLQKKITGQDWLRWIMVSASFASGKLRRPGADHIAACGIVTAFVSGRTTISWYGTWPTWLTSQTRPGVL